MALIPVIPPGFVNEYIRNQTKQRLERERAKTLKEQGVTANWKDITSYAGSDILCLMFIPSYNGENETDPGFVEVQDKLQTITVSSARSVMPVRRLGETNPAAYARGSRTIAGSMIFTSGLRDAFITALSKSFKDGEPSKEPTIFVDQIPKFSMTFQASNELGGVSSALLVNITLTNFGTTFSIDDIYTESTFTYVAEQYFPLSATTIDDKNAIRAMIMKSYLRSAAADVDLSSLFEDGLSAASTISNNIRRRYSALGQKFHEREHWRSRIQMENMYGATPSRYMYTFDDLPELIQMTIRRNEYRANEW